MAGGAGQYWFYHIEHTSLEAALAALLEKCLERGWRALVVAGPQRLGELDTALWSWRGDSFLAHARDDVAGPLAVRQPILLSSSPEPANAAKVAFLIDGSNADPDAFERCCVLFLGDDAAARANARATYKTAKDAGRTVRYFQQSSSGAWTEQGADPAKSQTPG